MAAPLYIPFWLYSNGKCTPGNFKVFGNFTFHSGYIPINIAEDDQGLDTTLYIPFWLYSNGIQALTNADIANFTFHSGYIPIILKSLVALDSDIFTFHSGYIPIESTYVPVAAFITLHSILVIFQLTAASSAVLWFVIFTFHSGYIPILCPSSIHLKRSTLHSILVIFQ